MELVDIIFHILRFIIVMIFGISGGFWAGAYYSIVSRLKPGEKKPYIMLVVAHGCFIVMIILIVIFAFVTNP